MTSRSSRLGSYFSVLLVLAVLTGCADEGAQDASHSSPAPEQPELQTVAASDGVQLTGLTVTEDKRTFVSFPRWRDIPYSVAEVTSDGRFVPYPNDAWNGWAAGAGDTTFVAVQSVVAADGALWVLDPASPKMAGVVDSGAKLVKIDLETDRVERIYRLNSDVAPEGSYMNDVRIDAEHQYAYVTDSGLGALVAIDLDTGAHRRLLDEHASTNAEDLVLEIGGEPLRFTDGSAPAIHADGIALDEEADSLYYHALTGYHLYRIPTEVLRDPSLEPSDRRAAVTDLGATPAPDGMMFGPDERLYMADLERNAVVYRRPDGAIDTLVQDPDIRWADTFSFGPSGALYFTDSRLQETEWFEEGADVREMQFPIYRVSASRQGE